MSEDVEAIKRACDMIIVFGVLLVLAPVMGGFLVLINDYLNERRERKR